MTMENFSVDAYKPKEIAQRIDQACISKSLTDPLRVFVLAVLAGAFIAFGAAFYTVVTYHSGGINPGVLRLMGGLVFSLGLILVIVAGAELFTGNNLLVMAYVDKKITLKQLVKNWSIVFFGNLVGALGLAVLMYLSGLWFGDVGEKVLLIANAKVNLSVTEAISRGILCNILVCLAVWLCFAGHTVTDKILAIVFPISAFVALGFEHSVANMYFIPAGLLAKYQPELLASMAETNPNITFDHLTLYGFLVKNLLPVTFGNIIGGSVFVGLVYWFVYLRD